MKHYAFLLAGVLCLALLACAQTAPPPISTTTLTSVSCGPGDDLLTHVHYTIFTPIPNTENVPTADSTPISQDVQRDLAAAFEANPSFAKNVLCGLTGIYINRTQCTTYDPGSCSTMVDTDIADNSWGFRTQPSGRKYVALSLGLWDNTNSRGPWNCLPPQLVCAPPFQTYHIRLIGALLDRTEKKDTSPPPPGKPPFRTKPSVQASPSTSGLTVLAALAHESGHIYWWDTFVGSPGSKMVSNTNSFCSPNVFYPGGSWEGALVDIPPGRFVEFGYIRQPPQADVGLLPRLLNSGQYANAGDVLHRIYSRGKWVSLLAAYSPDEDFVESFELSVLRNAGLQTLTINITGNTMHSENIVMNGNVGATLAAKLQCFNSLSQVR